MLKKKNNIYPITLDEEDRQIRDALFDKADGNGNGYLGYLELEIAMVDGILSKDPRYQNNERAGKRAIRKAYNAARKISPAIGGRDDDYVEREEFRMLIIYMKLYYDIGEIFEAIDDDDSKRLELDEFKAAGDKLEELGVDINHLEDEFKKIDTSNNGTIYITEFCDYASDVILKSCKKLAK